MALGFPFIIALNCVFPNKKGGSQPSVVQLAPEKENAVNECRACPCSRGRCRYPSGPCCSRSHQRNMALRLRTESMNRNFFRTAGVAARICSSLPLRRMPFMHRPYSPRRRRGPQANMSLISPMAICLLALRWLLMTQPLAQPFARTRARVCTMRHVCPTPAPLPRGDTLPACQARPRTPQPSPWFSRPPATGRECPSATGGLRALRLPFHVLPCQRPGIGSLNRLIV
jgi:hypothetical protein